MSFRQRQPASITTLFVCVSVNRTFQTIRTPSSPAFPNKRHHLELQLRYESRRAAERRLAPVKKIHQRPCCLQVCEGQPAAGDANRRDRMLCKAMCIGIAYSSNIGGISTLPGTSPNLIFSEFLNQ